MHGAPSRVNVDISDLKSSSMLRRIGGVSGLFVLLTLVWYLVFPFVTGCDMNTTAVETQECEELITPVLSFFCALPPLMIAVLVFVSTHGKKSKAVLENPMVDEEGKMQVPTGVQSVEESIKQTQLAQSGMGLGAVLMIGSYALILLAGVFLLLLALLCGMSMGNSCGDEGFESLLSWISVGSVGIKLGLAVFLISAAGKLVIEYQLDANGMLVETKPATVVSTMVRLPCPACGAKLRFPTEHQGEVQCPKCDHVFTVGTE